MDRAKDIADQVLNRLIDITYSYAGLVYQSQIIEEIIQLRSLVTVQGIRAQTWNKMEEKISEVINTRDVRLNLDNLKSSLTKIQVSNQAMIGRAVSGQYQSIQIIPIHFRSNLSGIILLFGPARFDNFYDWMSLEPLIQTLAIHLRQQLPQTI